MAQIQDEHERFANDIQGMSDADLVTNVGRNYGPARTIAFQLEMTRRLMNALDRSAASADKAARRLFWLTAVLVVLTLVLIFKA